MFRWACFQFSPKDFLPLQKQVSLLFPLPLFQKQHELLVARRQSQQELLFWIYPLFQKQWLLRCSPTDWCGRRRYLSPHSPKDLRCLCSLVVPPVPLLPLPRLFLVLESSEKPRQWLVQRKKGRAVQRRRALAPQSQWRVAQEYIPHSLGCVRESPPNVEKYRVLLDNQRVARWRLGCERSNLCH